MIDLKVEKGISVPQAARSIPPTRLDKPVHSSTIVRWILRGLRGVRLEAVRVGGRWVTTHEAIERFSAALTAKHVTPSIPPASPSRPTTATRLHEERVERDLHALGFRN